MLFSQSDEDGGNYGNEDNSWQEPCYSSSEYSISSSYNAYEPLHRNKSYTDLETFKDQFSKKKASSCNEISGNFGNILLAQQPRKKKKINEEGGGQEDLLSLKNSAINLKSTLSPLIERRKLQTNQQMWNNDGGLSPVLSLGENGSAKGPPSNESSEKNKSHRKTGQTMTQPKQCTRLQIAKRLQQAIAGESPSLFMGRASTQMTQNLDQSRNSTQTNVLQNTLTTINHPLAQSKQGSFKKQKQAPYRLLNLTDPGMMSFSQVDKQGSITALPQINNRQPNKEIDHKDGDRLLEINLRKSFITALDSYSVSLLVILLCLLLLGRDEYLRSNFLIQSSSFIMLMMATQYLLIILEVKYAFMFLAFCCLQYPQNQYSLLCLHSVLHFINSLIYLALSLYQIYHMDLKQCELDTNMNKIIKSDQYLKRLVGLVPYGIAVLNLDTVNHFNSSFAAVLKIQSSKEVTMMLTKLKRKKKGNKNGSCEQMGQDSSTTLNALNDESKMTNLKNDLEFILKNKDACFNKNTNTHTIYENYYIEQDDISFYSPAYTRSPDLNSQKKYQESQKNRPTAKKYYNISISPTTWQGRSCMLLTVRDITSEKIMDQQEVLDKLKNMIFKSYTHELKTPLNGICMSLETTQVILDQLIEGLQELSDGVEKQQDTQLKKISQDHPHLVKQESIRGQNQLVLIRKQVKTSKQALKQMKIMNSCSLLLKSTMHDFFDYNQLQNGEIFLNLSEFDITELIKEVSEAIKCQIQSSLVRFVLKDDSLRKYTMLNGPLKMTADRDRIQQVLFNLLINAIKFTSKGKIIFRVQLSQESKNQHVRFKVTDTGIGIKQDRLRNIFNLFEKSEQTNIQQYLNSQQKSAKMGLPISQNLCQMMSSEILVQSRVGVGSCFSFALPIQYTKDKTYTSQLLASSGQLMDIKENRPIYTTTNVDYGDNDNQSLNKFDEQGQQYKIQSVIFTEQRKRKLGSFNLVFNESSNKIEYSKKGGGFKVQQSTFMNKKQSQFIPDQALIQNQQKNIQSILGNGLIGKNYLNQKGMNQTLFEEIKQNGDNDNDLGQKIQFNVKMDRSRSQTNAQSCRQKLQKADMCIKQELPKSQPISPKFLMDIKLETIKEVNDQENKRRASVGSETTFGLNLVGKDISIEQIEQSEIHPSIDRSMEQKLAKIELAEIQDIKLQSLGLNLVQQSSKRVTGHDVQMFLKDIHRVHEAPNQTFFESLISKKNSDQQAVQGRKDVIQRQSTLVESPKRNENSIFNTLQDGQVNNQDPMDQTDDVPSDNEQIQKSPNKYSRSNAARHHFINQLDIQAQKYVPTQGSQQQQNDRINNIQQDLYIPENLQNDDDQASLLVPYAYGSFSNNAQYHQYMSQEKQEEILTSNEETKLMKGRDYSTINEQGRVKPMLKTQKSFQSNQYDNSQAISEGSQVSDASIDEGFNDKKRTYMAKEYMRTIGKNCKDKNNFMNVFKKSSSARQNRYLNLQKLKHTLSNDNIESQPHSDMNLDINVIQSPQFKASKISSMLSCHQQDVKEIQLVTFNEQQNHQDNDDEPCCPQVLIVDDVQMNRYALSTLISYMFGLSSSETQNGLECVEYLDSYYSKKICDCGGIRVIFMDIEMPVMNGLEATAKINKKMKEGKLPFIPIIGLTAYLDEKENGIKSGMVEFLVKPASSATLKNVLTQLKIIS